APQERRPQVGRPVPAHLPPLSPPSPGHAVLGALDRRRNRRARMTTAPPTPAPSGTLRSPELPRQAAWLVASLLLLGAVVRALQLVAPFHWPFHWDETMLATAALQVLHGELPFNAGQEYFGAAPSYAMAAWFALAGTSTLALDLFTYAIGLLIFWTSW